MSNEERDFEERKKKLILKCVTENFEKRVYEKLTSNELKTIEEVDAFVDHELKAVLQQREAIQEYFNSKMFA